jgi:mannan endo-1,4-beta-mannosidase
MIEPSTLELTAIEPTGPFPQAAIPRDPASMPYVRVAPGGRHFMTEDGAPFLVIGHNEGMPWPTMHHMHREEDLATTEAYIQMLAEHGVTVLRIMLEYCEDEDWFFENPVGQPVPATVLYWDDLIGLCERYGIRLLVMFWDTFFMSRRWEHHPYSAPGSGFDGPGSFCTSPTALEAQKARIRFFIDRWGDSPAIFAYDLLNEIHPYWGGSPADQARWLTEIAQFTKGYELERWGKRHLVTVSIFGAFPETAYLDLIMRHPELDFVSTHVYIFGLVDNPENTIDGALVMRDAVRHAFSQMDAVRPYMDTESGPIHLFMDLKRTLPAAFDAEYLHNMSWAHLATGGAGSGMRWPFREPHALTPGMHAVQRGMRRFVPALDWVRFSPEPWNHRMRVVAREAVGNGATDRLPVLAFGCGDGRQALAWVLRDLRVIGLETVLPAMDLIMPGLEPGRYVAEFWETYEGLKMGEQPFTVAAPGGLTRELRLPLALFVRDLAVAIKRVEEV